MAKMPNYSTKQLAAIARLQGHFMAMERMAGAMLKLSLLRSEEFAEVDEIEPHKVEEVSSDDLPLLLVGIAGEGKESRVPRLPKTDKAVAIIQVRGSIGQRRGGDFWGGTFSEDVDNQLRSMAANPNIGAIVMDFDTPGGIVTGIPELGETIQQVKQLVPVYSLANGMSASAGFWLSSQATKAFVTPSGEVGSHGVWSMHADVSKMLEEIGIDITLISAGDHKVEGNPFEPLGPEAKAEIQRGVNIAMGQFTKALATGRDKSKQAVLDNFGQGHMFGSVGEKNAMDRGMVDGVATLSELLAGIIKPREGGQGRARSLALDIAIEEEMGR